jgi:hypothetical protein
VNQNRCGALSASSEKAYYQTRNPAQKGVSQTRQAEVATSIFYLGEFMEAMIELICENCGCAFVRRLSEHKRNLKKNRRAFCSLKCCATDNIKNIPIEKRYTFNVGVYADNRKDEFSFLRFAFEKAKRHSKEKGCEFSITLHELLDKYERQRGLCIYTGWIMETKADGWSPKRITLDKIDPKYGYRKENVQLLSFSANLAKNSFTHEQMVTFCKSVRNYWNIPNKEENRKNEKLNLFEKYGDTEINPSERYNIIRYSFSLARRHASERNIEFSIDLETVLKKYIEQGGICSYSGIKLIRNSERKANREIGTISIDRINSDVGYIESNIQLLCLPANFGKSVFSHRQMLEFCESISVHWNEQ